MAPGSVGTKLVVCFNRAVALRQGMLFESMRFKLFTGKMIGRLGTENSDVLVRFTIRQTGFSWGFLLYSFH
jgi:hypothetical protein